MVLILDGNPEHVAHALENTSYRREIRYVAAFNVIKCLKQIKLQIAPYVRIYF